MRLSKSRLTPSSPLCALCVPLRGLCVPPEKRNAGPKARVQIDLLGAMGYFTGSNTRDGALSVSTFARDGAGADSVTEA